MLDEDGVQNRFVDIFENVGHSDSPVDVDNLVNDFTDILFSVADPLFTVNTPAHCTKSYNNCHPAWMSNKCLQLRVEYFRCLSEFRSNQIDATRIQKVAARSAYTKCVRICKRNYDKEYTQRLTMRMHSNPKEFWKSFRPGKRTLLTTIKPNDYFVYFKSISNPKNIIYEADDDIFEHLRTYQQGQLQTEYDQLKNHSASKRACLGRSSVGQQ